MRNTAKFKLILLLVGLLTITLGIGEATKKPQGQIIDDEYVFVEDNTVYQLFEDLSEEEHSRINDYYSENGWVTFKIGMTLQPKDTTRKRGLWEKEVDFTSWRGNVKEKIKNKLFLGTIEVYANNNKIEEIHIDKNTELEVDPSSKNAVSGATFKFLLKLPEKGLTDIILVPKIYLHTSIINEFNYFLEYDTELTPTEKRRRVHEYAKKIRPLFDEYTKP